jgi:hypothetical protein
MSNSLVLVVVMCSHGTKGIGMIVISCVQWPLINILKSNGLYSKLNIANYRCQCQLAMIKQYDMILITGCYRVCLERYVLSLAEAESLKHIAHSILKVD